MTEKKLNELYYQPDHLRTGDKHMRELHKITSVPKRDIKRLLAKQVLWQVHILPPKEINHPHCDVTKRNGQHHWVKSVRIQSYSRSHFTVFGMRTERYGVSLCVKSDCGK